jgi:hypothetical protein
MTDTLKTLADHYGVPIEFAGYIDVPLSGEAVVKVSPDHRPGTFYGGVFLTYDADRPEDEHTFIYATVTEVIAFVDAARRTF